MLGVAVVEATVVLQPAPTATAPPASVATTTTGDTGSLLGDGFDAAPGARAPSPAVSVNTEDGSVAAAGGPPVVTACFPASLAGDASGVVKQLPTFAFPDLAFVTKHFATAPLASLSLPCVGEEYAFALTASNGVRTYGCCRRFRRIGATTTGRLDAPVTSVQLVALCVVTERPFFAFFYQTLHLLQWLHAFQPAALPAACNYLTAAVGRYWSNPTAPGCPAPGVPTAALWRGMLRALGTALPPHLTFLKERVHVPTGDVNDALAQTPLAPLLFRLQPHTLLVLFTALLCERRVVLVSRYVSTLSACVHAALNLLFPLQWSNIFVPLVPPDFLRHCCAPSPLLVGLRPSQFRQLQAMEAGPLVVVNLDEGYLAVTGGCPPIPDVSGCHPTAVAGRVSYSGPSLELVNPAARPGMTTTAARGTDDGTAPSPTDGPGGITRLHALLTASGGRLPVATGSHCEEATALGAFHSAARCRPYTKDAVVARLARRSYFRALARCRTRTRSRRSSVHGRSRSRSSVGTDGTGMEDVDGLTSALASTLTSIASPTASTPRVAFTDSDSAGSESDGGRLTPVHDTDTDTDTDTDGGDSGTASDGHGDAGGGVEDSAAMWDDLEATVGVTATVRQTRGADHGAGSFRQRLKQSTLSLRHRIVSSKLGRKIGKGVRDKLHVGGGGGSPGVRLFQELRDVYAAERRDGVVDEPRVRAALLAFMVLLFGRADEFVERPPGGDKRTYPTFQREAFVRVRHHRTLRLLMKELLHVQMLEDHAVARFRARVDHGEPPLPDVFQVACSELLSASGKGRSGTTFGTLLRLAKPMFTCGVEPDGDGAAGPVSPKGPVSPTPAAAGGSGAGVGNLQAATRRLASLSPSELRGHLVAVTSNHQRAPPGYPSVASYTRKVFAHAAAATHRPVYVDMVLGVVWDRLNDCKGKDWQHGRRALRLLHHLLVFGSVRVATMTTGWLPLLRHLVLPSLHTAVLAAEWTAHACAWPSCSSIVQASNASVAARHSAAGITRAAMAAVSSSSSSGSATPHLHVNTDGVQALRHAAIRVYVLLVSPQRLAVERTIGLAPAHAASVSPPYPYPLHAVTRTDAERKALAARGSPVRRVPALGRRVPFRDVHALFRPAMDTTVAPVSRPARGRGGSADLLGLTAGDDEPPAVARPPVKLAPPPVPATRKLVAPSHASGEAFASPPLAADAGAASGWLEAADGFGPDWAAGTNSAVATAAAPTPAPARASRSAGPAPLIDLEVCTDPAPAPAAPSLPSPADVFDSLPTTTPPSVPTVRGAPRPQWYPSPPHAGSGYSGYNGAGRGMPPYAVGGRVGYRVAPPPPPVPLQRPAPGTQRPATDAFRGLQRW